MTEHLVFTHSHVVVVEDRDMEQTEVFGPFSRAEADLLAQEILTAIEASDALLDATFVEVRELHSPSVDVEGWASSLAHDIVPPDDGEEES